MWSVKNQYVDLSLYIVSILAKTGILYTLVIFNRRKKFKKLAKITGGGYVLTKVFKIDLSKCVEAGIVYQVKDSRLRKSIFGLVKKTSYWLIVETLFDIITGYTVKNNLIYAGLRTLRSISHFYPDVWNSCQ